MNRDERVTNSGDIPLSNREFIWMTYSRGMRPTAPASYCDNAHAQLLIAQSVTRVVPLSKTPKPIQADPSFGHHNQRKNRSETNCTSLSEYSCLKKSERDDGIVCGKKDGWLSHPLWRFTADLGRDGRSPRDDGIAIANLSAAQFVNNGQVHKTRERGSPTIFWAFSLSRLSMKAFVVPTRVKTASQTLAGQTNLTRLSMSLQQME